MGRRGEMVINNLSDRANRWLKSQSNAAITIEQLIELAADPKSYVSLKIAQALNLAHPDRVSLGRAGAPVTVADEALICLRDDGLNDAEIARQVGLSRGQVGKRLRKIKREDKNNA